MKTQWTILNKLGKPFFTSFALCAMALNLAACSTNPATGKSQFTALMSPQQENQVGASEHTKIMQQFGEYQNSKVQNYVREIGAKVSADTERPDVQYKFYVLDTPMVNAFALPGGYVYASRGLIALANSEAELAAVLAHETGHITGRHSAERYSTGTLTSLGAGILGAAIGSQGVSQALGLGSNLYLSSYSRGQENEADDLGLRYMTRGGYSASAMPAFLSSLQNSSNLDAKLQGKEGQQGVSYFSTHPATGDRVNKTAVAATAFGQGGIINRDSHLSMINGMVFGDSAKQGFVRGQNFSHTELDLTFSVPNGFNITNQPSQVVATSKSGAAIVFDMVGNKAGTDPLNYLTQNWVKSQPVQSAERITVNGMRGATASLPGQVNGRGVTIQLVAVQWSEDRIARFQIAIPQGTSAGVVSELKKASYSLRRLSAKEKRDLRPFKVKIVTAKSGDTVASLARRQPYTTLQEERFRVLNALRAGEGIQAGKQYKLVSQ